MDFYPASGGSAHQETESGSRRRRGRGKKRAGRNPGIPVA